MPSAEETETTEEAEAAGPVDEARSALLEALTGDLGDALVASHLEPGRDLWIRVSTEAWGDTADYLRNRQRFRFFDWLSAIDWLPSPFGRSLGALVDVGPAEQDLAEFSSDDENSQENAEPVGQGGSADDPGGLTGTGADGITGGDTRFQVFARVYSLSTGLGVNLKADVPEINGVMNIGTWVDTYPGAAWHERETHEMFGINFVGNEDMRNLYLPAEFEGYPLRKDFPLLARLVKPWPGIVDVEPMPQVEGDESETPGVSTSNPEGGS